MKPKKPVQHNNQHERFCSELVHMISPNHSLVKLSKAVDWRRLEKVLGETYCADNGCPAISIRLMAALKYLKYSYDLSDDDVIQGWLENPYWQYLTGMKFFEYKIPIHPSRMTRWRNRIGETGGNY